MNTNIKAEKISSSSSSSATTGTELEQKRKREEKELGRRSGTYSVTTPAAIATIVHHYRHKNKGKNKNKVKDTNTNTNTNARINFNPTNINTHRRNEQQQEQQQLEEDVDQRENDNLNTSFEIDEPDDETFYEIDDNGGHSIAANGTSELMRKQKTLTMQITEAEAETETNHLQNVTNSIEMSMMLMRTIVANDCSTTTENASASATLITTPSTTTSTTATATNYKKSSSLNSLINFTACESRNDKTRILLENGIVDYKVVDDNSDENENGNEDEDADDDNDDADVCILPLRNIPLVDIRDDSGEQSDISLGSTDTDSSTPTTADIADLNAVASSLFANGIRKQQQQQQHPQLQNIKNYDSMTQNSRLNIIGSNIVVGLGSNGGGGGGSVGGNSSNAIANFTINSNNGSIADDNLSGSIATTTTEIDADNLTVASPNMSLTATSIRMHATHPTHPSHPAQSTLNTAANVVNVVGDASAIVNGQHPSAAYLQRNDTRQCDAIISTSSNHKRTLSAASYRSTTSQHPSLSAVSVHSVHSRFYNWIRWICVFFKSSGIGEPSVYHALVVIFLEFFAWGLLTMPVISVLNQTFPDHTFLMNGLVMGIKGILSFLSAPLIGALSDIWGRKFFLLITVFFTCAPIPLMTINSWWFFAMISISGIFAVTFSVVFAYVADVTTVEERSRAYGLVSATFAASLVISPALGAALMEMYSDTLVVALATAIAVLDVFFILVAVPESLPEKVRPSSWGAPISWEQADPFAALRKVGTDHTILMQCVTVLLSYLPEAGQYSCIFVYIKLKMGFNTMEVAIFIAVVGILSIGIQVTLGYLMRVLGAKRTIILGLVLEMLQLLWYGFGSQKWMMWAAGILAALGSITYPAISAFVSIHSTPDRQGAVQGMVTGMRGLCNGLGPAMFGVIFYLFNVDLNADHVNAGIPDSQAATYKSEKYAKFIPGPPFAFGAFMVILAILVAIFIPEGRSEIVGLTRTSSEKKRISLDVQYEIEAGHKATGPLAPLMRSDSLAQL